MKALLPKSFLFALALFFLAGCEKDDEDLSIRSAIDMGVAELTFPRLVMLAKNLSPIDGDYAHMAANTCANIDSIVGDTANFPASGDSIQVFLTFPDSGCVDLDQRLKKGKLSIVYFGELESIGAEARIMPNGLLGGVGRSTGRIDIIRSSALSFQVQYSDCFVSSNSWSILYAGSMSMTQTDGTGTLDPGDDAYRYEGDWSCTDREGTPFEARTLNPVVLSMDCPWNTMGYFRLDPEGRNQRVLDYGEGTCDGDMVVTADGTEQTVIYP